MPTLDGPRRQPRGRQPDALVVLIHGYGANGDDLIALADAMAPVLPGAAFAAPDAPDVLPHAGFAGRQWFPLTLRDPTEYWRGVTVAGPLLDAFLDAELSRLALPPQRLALVGFSQGTMMALHLAPRRKVGPACVVGYSGLIAGPESLAGEITSHPPVMLIHGEDDEVIPVAALHLAREALAAAGMSIEWHQVPGLGHGIDDTGLNLAAAFLAEHLYR